jgi:hypothetical protein
MNSLFFSALFKKGSYKIKGNSLDLKKIVLTEKKELLLRLLIKRLINFRLKGY